MLQSVAGAATATMTGALMKFSLVVVGALIAFDLVVAVLTTLSLITPPLAIGLLLTNPLALALDHQWRVRRARSAAEDRDQT